MQKKLTPDQLLLITPIEIIGLDIPNSQMRFAGTYLLELYANIRHLGVLKPT